MALEQLNAAQTRINGLIVLGKEAIGRSSSKLGVYEILYQLHQKHGVPFQNGPHLPEEYKDRFPEHTMHDGILKGVKKKQAREAAQRKEESKSPEGSHRSIEGRGTNASRSGDSTAELEESIPHRFRPRLSDGSDEDNSGNEYDGGSENDGNWALDPNADGDSDRDVEYERTDIGDTEESE